MNIANQYLENSNRKRKTKGKHPFLFIQLSRICTTFFPTQCVFFSVYVLVGFLWSSLVHFSDCEYAEKKNEKLSRLNYDLRKQLVYSIFFLHFSFSLIRVLCVCVCFFSSFKYQFAPLKSSRAQFWLLVLHKVTYMDKLIQTHTNMYTIIIQNNTVEH